jgi:hypothetical protein
VIKIKNVNSGGKFMNWLEIIKDEMKKSTMENAMECWPPFQGRTEPYFNFRFEHAKHVEKIALQLFAEYGGDEEIIRASAWIHDIAKFKEGSHAENAGEWASQNLLRTGFPAHKIKDVVYAVSNHAGWEIRGLETTEAKILWDADKLAHFGPVYLLDLIFWSTSEKICEQQNTPDLKYNETISIDNFIQRFSNFGKEADKDGWQDRMLYFEKSKKLVDRYNDANRIFYQVLEEQSR